MRRFVPTLITTLLLSVALLPTAVHAQTTVSTVSPNPSMASQLANQLSPFDLVSLAYQGYLKDQGIPEAGALISAIASGKITAQDMIQGAVKANRLPAPMLSNQSYRYHLEGQLRGLTEDN
jgi:hypothetical protein